MREGAVVKPEALKAAGWENTGVFYAGFEIWKNGGKRILRDHKDEKIHVAYDFNLQKKGIVHRVRGNRC